MPLGRGDDTFQQVDVRVAAVAFVALVAAIVPGWPWLVPVAVALVGGTYAVELAIDDAPLDVAAPVVAVGLLLAAELAYWSLDEREPTRSATPGEGLRRAAFVALPGVGALVVAERAARARRRGPWPGPRTRSRGRDRSGRRRGHCPRDAPGVSRAGARRTAARAASPYASQRRDRLPERCIELGPGRCAPSDRTVRVVLARLGAGIDVDARRRPRRRASSTVYVKPVPRREVVPHVARGRAPVVVETHLVRPRAVRSDTRLTRGCARCSTTTPRSRARCAAGRAARVGSDRLASPSGGSNPSGTNKR